MKHSASSSSAPRSRCELALIRRAGIRGELLSSSFDLVHAERIAQGGQNSGRSLYLHEGRPAYCYNVFGLELFKVYGDVPVPTGEHEVRMEFTYDGDGLGKGGDVVLSVDGEHVGAGSVRRTVAMIFSFDETTDLGEDTGSSVSDDYSPRDSSFNVQVRWVQIDVESEGAREELIDPDDIMRIAMSKQ